MITPQPSGDGRDALIAKLTQAIAWEEGSREDNLLMQAAADMLAADAQEIQRVTEMARTEKRLADMHCEEKLAIKAQQVAAPDAWELAEKVWKDLDRRSCPGIYMQIATESIVKHCATPPAPQARELIDELADERLAGMAAMAVWEDEP